ncbi:MAG: alpha/beta hydrolase [Nitrospirota bacterium]
MTSFRVDHTITDGIERIVYRPDAPRFKTPLLMQHGMWHGAWCWRYWQEQLAMQGWESYAYSLPGHGTSPGQRAVRWCTFGYYLKFLAAEVARLPRRPVVLGHSMGGALTQRYLKQVGDLPAAVLVASWPSHSIMPDLLDWIGRDPWGIILSLLTLTSTPAVRNMERAADLLITRGALVTPDELFKRLGAESMWIVLQHQAPFWSPRLTTGTPLLWIAGTHDKATKEARHRASAASYAADYVAVEGAGHNLMMDGRSSEAAEAVHQWLLSQNIA